MKETVFFLNMFPDYEPPEALQSVLSQAAIVAADIDPQHRSVEVAIHSEQYIPMGQLRSVADDLRNAYGLRALEITSTHPAHQLRMVQPEELMALFVAQNSMNRAILAGAEWRWEEDTLHIQLRGNGVKDLSEAVANVRTDLRQRFAAPVEISIHAGEALEGKALFDAMNRMRGTYLQHTPGAAPSTEKAVPAKSESNTFYGKPIRTPAIPMKELSLDMGSVTVEGKVFAVEHKELKKRNAWVINFDMTDNSGSIRVNRFMEAGEAKPILENVKVG